jgi:hypothetical protein
MSRGKNLNTKGTKYHEGRKFTAELAKNAKE